MRALKTIRFNAFIIRYLYIHLKFKYVILKSKNTFSSFIYLWLLSFWGFSFFIFFFFFFFFFFYFFFIFYIWRKCWNHENFRLPVFNGFTRFRMSWTRFHVFIKCLRVCCRNFAATVKQKLMNRTAWNFTFSCNLI